MLTRNQFLVKEHVGLLKLSNTYDIFDPATNQKLGVAQEQPGALIHILRFLINKQMLPTKVVISEGAGEQGTGKEVLTIRRGLTFLRSKIRVQDADGEQIGYFKSKLFSFGGGFWLYDTKDQKIAEIKGDWKGWNFKLLDTKGKELGLITKKWAGLGKELFTSADTYMISIADEATADAGLKLLLLAAGIAIDTVFKEK